MIDWYVLTSIDVRIALTTCTAKYLFNLSKNDVPELAFILIVMREILLVNNVHITL